MTVLVTGGCGYIGSHVVRELLALGEAVVVIDDLSTGIAQRIVPLEPVRYDLADQSAVDRLVEVMRSHEVDAVIHLAALKQVGESVQEPTKYFRVNLMSLSNVIDAARIAGVQNLVFSSSAAVYGNAIDDVSEESPTQPMNPYGQTKLVGEWLVEDATRAFGLSAVNLRYFNVAGAETPELGDQAVLNVVPMVIERISRGLPPQIFGGDYDTVDGTCVRDYIHVGDLADAHIAALAALRQRNKAGECHVYNVGTGLGYSVKEMVDMLLSVSNSSLTPEILDRRDGDPATIVADPGKIQRELGWVAKRGVREMVESAWNAYLFHRKLAGQSQSIDRSER